MFVVDRFKCPHKATRETIKIASRFYDGANHNVLKHIGNSITYKNRVPILVFDIDDTLIRENGDSIDTSIEILNHFREKHAKVFLVTARHGCMKKETQHELLKAGIKPGMYDDISYSPQIYRDSLARISVWKKAKRQSIGIQWRLDFARSRVFLLIHQANY